VSKITGDAAGEVTEEIKGEVGTKLGPSGDQASHKSPNKLWLS
jgi:hypothetical protein